MLKILDNLNLQRNIMMQVNEKGSALSGFQIKTLTGNQLEPQTVNQLEPQTQSPITPSISTCFLVIKSGAAITYFHEK